MDTLQLDLDIVLPHAHDARDRCVGDLVTALEGLDGVDSVHIIDDESDDSAEVCLHLEPGAVAIARLEDRVRVTGAEIESRYGHMIIEADSVGHAARARALTERLRGLDGVVDAAVSIEGVVRIEYDSTVTDQERLLGQLAGIGLGSVRSIELPVPDLDHGAREHEHVHGASRVELAAALVALVVYLVARWLDWFTEVGSPVTGLYMAAAGITGVFVARDAWLSARARVFDIDQLMLVAAVGAAFLGHWSDAALLLVLFSLGHALEGYAMNRARHAIESLGELAPSTARLVDDPGSDRPVGDLIVGDVVLVRPHERLPADGVIVAGETSVDESAVTGESVPVDKRAVADSSTLSGGIESVARHHRVFAGTLNGPSVIEVMVLRTATDSTLARVVHLVAEAETQISPAQRLTKRIVRVFVPAVLALVVALLVVPPLIGEPFADSFARAMAVLVAASPCALAIATPSAVLAAIARGARSGILIKGGGPLEVLGTVSAIAFDKTGTLTEGEPILTDVVVVEGVEEAELLSPALALERLSDHPIARAITASLDARPGTVPDATASKVEEISGKGITGVVDGEIVNVGNASLFGEVGPPPSLLDAQRELERNGRTTMIVRHGDRYLGLLGVMDTPRAGAESTVAALAELGIGTVVMLSGDNQRVASAIGRQVGIQRVEGGLLPGDKVEAVKLLALEGGVAMVGDGVNDAPALAAASVGIAMGAAGSDVALETADIALMTDHIDRLPLAVGLARRAARTIRQNLFFSLAVVAVLLPMTILGVGISVAVIAHEGSTLIVVGNALRILNHDRKDS